MSSKSTGMGRLDEPIVVPVQPAPIENQHPVEPTAPAVIPVVERPVAVEMPPSAPALVPAPAPAPVAAPALQGRCSMVEIIDMTANLDPELREKLLRRFLEEISSWE